MIVEFSNTPTNFKSHLLLLAMFWTNVTSGSTDHSCNGLLGFTITWRS